MTERKWDELSEKQRSLVTDDINQSLKRLSGVRGGPDIPGQLTKNEKLEAYQVAVDLLKMLGSPPPANE